jgi:hypothetical protein
MKIKEDKIKYVFVVLFFMFGLSILAFKQFNVQGPVSTNMELRSSGAVTYVALEKIPGITDGGEVNMRDFLQRVFEMGIAVAVILAIIMTIYGGIRYMTVESIGGKKSSIGIIQGAIFGLILALSSWVILNSINPDIFSPDNLIINPK